jgi:hypothetical protein
MAYDGDLQMIDATSVRVHQHAACAQINRADPAFKEALTRYYGSVEDPRPLGLLSDA